MAVLTSQYVEFHVECPRCGKRAIRIAIQLIRRDELRWDLVGRCNSCADMFQSGGLGKAPEEIRQAMLIVYGESRICLLNEAQNRGRVIQVKAERLRGTRMEMELLARRYRANGVEVVVA